MRRPLSRSVGRGSARDVAPRARACGRLLTTASLLAVVGLSSACSAGPAPESTVELTGSSAGGTVAPTATPAPPPTLVPDGTATDNLPYFTSVVEAVWAGSDNVRGLAYIDALSDAGFDRSTMQVTADTTTIGQPAESIQFSVAWRDGCLVGQVGPATGDPVSTVLPLLPGGRCLVGQTASVDG